MVRVRKATVIPTKVAKDVGDASFKTPPKKRMGKSCRGKLSHASPPRVSTRAYFAKFLQTHLVENQNPQLDCRIWQSVVVKTETTEALRPIRIDVAECQVPAAGRSSPRRRDPPATPTLPSSCKTESHIDADLGSKSNEAESNLGEVKPNTLKSNLEEVKPITLESNLDEVKPNTLPQDSDPCPEAILDPEINNTLLPVALDPDLVPEILSPEMVPNFVEEVLISFTIPSPILKTSPPVKVESVPTPSLPPSAKPSELVISPTPHKIQLFACAEPQQSPSSAMSHLHISVAKKPGVKSRRRLNPSQSANQQPAAVKAAPPKRSYTTKKEIALTNHKVTEYFPIRRSIRKTKRTVLEEKQLVLEKAVKADCEEGLEVRNFEGKGRGIVATRPFARGDFVVEYCGELIDMGEAKTREQLYTQDQNTGCYMYYFKHKNNQYCIDATKESGRLGRLVNHSRSGNLTTKTVCIGSRPHLVLLAKDPIATGEEVLYDYGDRSKESLVNHPWLNL